MTEKFTGHDRYAVLKLRSKDTNKLALSISYVFKGGGQAAFEQMQLDDWIRLIDFSLVGAARSFELYRIFKLEKVAVEWVEKFESGEGSAEDYSGEENG